MAMILREDYRLPTLRFSMEFVNREPFVRIRAYHGREELTGESIPAAEIGISERLSVDSYRSVQFDLPQEVIGRLDSELRPVRQGGPLWLQIDRSDGYLAVVPWERLLAREMRGPFLRIPNFLVDPPAIKGPLALVICASAPAAKEFYPVNIFAGELIEHVRQAVAQGTEIHVFADKMAYPALRERFGGDGNVKHSLTIYDPETAVPFGAGTSETSGSEKLSSPWLRWMDAELGDRAIDAVHFLCPGFFQNDSGFLALARSPLKNEDASWSHFVGAPELRTFLDELGAGAVVLGAPSESVWTLGLRLLADELAWTRPGPVMVYKSQDDQGQDNLVAMSEAYSFLFSEGYKPPPESGELLLYCHPRRLERNMELLAFESPILSSGDQGHDWFDHTKEVVSRLPGVDQLVKGVSEEPQPEPRWARSNRMMIKQSLLDAVDQQGDTARGAAKALRFLSRLQDKYLGEE